MKSSEIHRKGRWLLLPYIRLVIDHDLGAAASHIFSRRRRQSYSISKSTSSRQSRRILPKSVIFYLATDSGH